MKNYLHLLRQVLEHGQHKSDRTGTGTRSLFAYSLRFDLRNGFPLLTTKRVHFKSIATELVWLLRGDTNVKFLQDNGCTIWDEWADTDGDLGPVYGAQWRRWGGDGSSAGIDQVANVLEGLKKDPHGRRHIVSAWNPTDVPKMKLPPCHMAFQFYVSGDDSKDLSCHMYQRSADILLGVPFNIASYALLTHIVAAHCGMFPYELVISFGDVHLYQNHVDQAKIQLQRTPKPLPQLLMSPPIVANEDIFSLDPRRFSVQNYVSDPPIKAAVAI